LDVDSLSPKIVLFELYAPYKHPIQNLGCWASKSVYYILGRGRPLC